MLKEIKPEEMHQSHRGYFAGCLYNEMIKDNKVVVVTGDLGFGVFDRIRADFPNRFYNVGAAEAAGVGICVGMAQEGLKPFFFTITSFFLRAAETISLYLDHENVSVRLVGSGRDDDYGHDGHSHYCYKAQDFIKSAKLMEYYPENKEQIPDMIKRMVEKEEASFISLRR